jgi:hypothetical protein
VGLDMYLNKKIYIGAEYAHRNVKGEINLTQGAKNDPIKINLSKISEIIERTGYWRKANAIHKWFVDNVQEGIDECQEHYVTTEKLTELKALCEEILVSRDATKLPPTKGFFFGSDQVDEYYFDDLKATIEILNTALEDEDGEYYYRSSW